MRPYCAIDESGQPAQKKKKRRKGSLADSFNAIRDSPKVGPAGGGSLEILNLALPLLLPAPSPNSEPCAAVPAAPPCRS